MGVSPTPRHKQTKRKEKNMPNYTVFIGAIILLIIYYWLGTAPLFCAVGGLISGSFIEKVELRKEIKC